MKKMLLFFGLVIGLLGLSAQTTIKIQPGSEDGKDARVFSLDCSASYAVSSGKCREANLDGEPEIDASTWTYEGTWAQLFGYIQFDISSIDFINKNVEKVLLKLHHNTNLAVPSCGSSSTHHACQDNSMEIKRVLSAWEEDQITYNNQPTVTGSTSTTEDYILISDYSNQVYDSLVVDLTSMTKYWIENPTQNFGIQISLLDLSNSYKSMRFYSSDHSDPDKRPSLEITYTTSLGLNDYNEQVLKSIYPNPSNGEVTLTFGGDKPVNIDLYDITGKLMLNYNDYKNSELKINGLKQGVYYVKIFNDKAEVTQRIVVTH